MRPSYVRVVVFELLELHGPLTRREFVALDPTLSANMSSLLLKWWSQGLVSREHASDRVHPTYRYTLTAKGRAVLVTDRIDREAGEFERVGSLKTIQVGDRTLTITEAAAELGLKPKTLRARINRRMAPKDVLQPLRAPRRVDVEGKALTVRQAATRAGVSYDTMRRRLGEGKRGRQAAAPPYYRETCSRGAIQALLATSAVPMTLREIATALGFQSDAVRGHLDRMRIAREVVCERGHAPGNPLLYSLPPGDAKS